MDIFESLIQQYIEAGFVVTAQDKDVVFEKTYPFTDKDGVNKQVNIEVKYDKEYPLLYPVLTDTGRILTSMHSINGYQCWARFSDIFSQAGLGIASPTLVEGQIKKLIDAHIRQEFYTINESPEFAFVFSSRNALDHARFFMSCEVLEKAVKTGHRRVIRGLTKYDEKTNTYYADDEPHATDIGTLTFVDKPQGKNIYAYYLNVGAVPHFDGRIDDVNFLFLLEQWSGLEPHEGYLQNIQDEIFIIAVFMNEGLGHHDFIVLRRKDKKLTLLPHARVSSRPVLFSRHKEEAIKLQDVKLALLGIGAIGSILAMTLLQSGIDHLFIIDPDCVDLENTTRSIYNEYDIGIRKTLALKRHATIKDADFGDRVTVLEELADIVRHNPDLLIICIGDLHEEYRISRIIRKANYDKAVFVFGQNDCTWGGIYFQDDPKLGCQECLFLHQKENRELQIPYKAYLSEAVGCGKPSYVSSPADIGLIANLSAKLIIDRLTSNRSRSPNYYIWQSNPEPSTWTDCHTEQYSIKKYRVLKHEKCSC